MPLSSDIDYLISFATTAMRHECHVIFAASRLSLLLRHVATTPPPSRHHAVTLYRYLIDAASHESRHD